MFMFMGGDNVFGCEKNEDSFFIKLLLAGKGKRFAPIVICPQRSRVSEENAGELSALFGG